MWFAFGVLLLAASAIAFAVEWRRQLRARRLDAHLRRTMRHIQLAAATIGFVFLPALRRSVEAARDFQKSMERVQKIMSNREAE